MNTQNRPISMGQMSTTSAVNSIADSAILATLIATTTKMDGATIEEFRKVVHKMISAPTSGPSEAAIAQLVRERVDAVINNAKTFSGN
ncbi:hypothetical protein [Burkholderia ubonensis]|uniref:hypothetical protein n=1 Tax=Burkholderia ubonensis TaxID=101571 RepID=UPI00076C91E6|nr:hypothetical protein [Burkholderia ubonensis]KVP40853.1 hypothetical protein WJ89_18550 [Burkholderia ubonensis]